MRSFVLFAGDVAAPQLRWTDATAHCWKTHVQLRSENEPVLSLSEQLAAGDYVCPKEGCWALRVPSGYTPAHGQEGPSQCYRLFNSFIF